jgi:hypothetical protein
MYAAMTTSATRHQPPAREETRVRLETLPSHGRKRLQPAGRKGLALARWGGWLVGCLVLAFVLIPVLLWAVLLSVLDPLHSWRRGRGKVGRGGIHHARFA